MEHKTVLITGANSGIGLETAKQLAKLGARLILACRSLERGNTAKAEIYAETQNDNVTVRLVDLSHQESIRKFAVELRECENTIDVLILNAGVALSTVPYRSVDNIELTMATNHLGPFLLTHLLLDLVLKTDAGRIVVVASSFHRFSCSKFPLNPIDYVYYYPALSYCNSKLANIYFAIELARRLAHTNVTVNCLHPGIVQTSIFRNALCMRMIKGIFKTVEEGAATTVYLASSPKVSMVSGKYFVECKERELSAKYLKESIHRKLWDDSLELVGLSAAASEIMMDVTHL